MDTETINKLMACILQKEFTINSMGYIIISKMVSILNAKLSIESSLGSFTKITLEIPV